MVKKQKYRVHAKTHDTYNSTELRFVVQVKRLGIWWTITEEFEEMKEADGMCSTLNECNNTEK